MVYDNETLKEDVTSYKKDIKHIEVKISTGFGHYGHSEYIFVPNDDTVRMLMILDHLRLSGCRMRYATSFYHTGATGKRPKSLNGIEGIWMKGEYFEKNEL